MQVLTSLVRSTLGLKGLAHLVQVQTVPVLKDQGQSDCDHQQLVQEYLMLGLTVLARLVRVLIVQELKDPELSVYVQR